MISKYDRIFDFGVKLDIFDFLLFFVKCCCNVYLKNGIVQSCFQQSAKGKMIAQTTRKHHLFNRNSTLWLHLPIKPRFSNWPPLCVSLSNQLFYRRYVPSMYNRSNRSNRSFKLNRLNKLSLAEAQQLKN